VRVEYLHSEIDTLQRVQSSEPQERKFDVLVGVNLLREGLDPSGGVARANPGRDKEGICASAGFSIQTCGAPHRNVNGRALMYRQDDRLDARRSTRPTARRAIHRLQPVTWHHPDTIVKRTTTSSEASTADYLRCRSIGEGEEAAAVRRRSSETPPAVRTLRAESAFEERFRDRVRYLKKIFVARRLNR